jgi:hypothetical protein
MKKMPDRQFRGRLFRPDAPHDRPAKVSRMG